MEKNYCTENCVIWEEKFFLLVPRPIYNQPFIHRENLRRLIPEPINLNKAKIDPCTLSTALCYISNSSSSLIVTTIRFVSRFSHSLWGITVSSAHYVTQGNQLARHFITLFFSIIPDYTINPFTARKIYSLLLGYLKEISRNPIIFR